MSGDETKDRFIEFYNASKIEAAAQTDSELVERITKLEGLCLEAKANLRAYHEEYKERKAKLSHSRKEWIVSPGVDQTTNDAIVAVKERKSRMSKADKLLESLKAAGLDADFIKQTEQKLRVVPTSTLNKATFNKVPDLPDGFDLDKAIKVAEEATKKTQPFNPFDPTAPKSEPSEQPFNPFAK